MLTLTNTQRKIVNQLNNDITFKRLNIYERDFIYSTKGPSNFFNEKLSDANILKVLLASQYYSNKQLINLSNPQEEHKLALKLALYKAPQNFNHFSDHDIKEYLILYKNRFTDLDLPYKLLKIGINDAVYSLHGPAKFVAHTAIETAEHYGLFNGDKIDIDLYKKFDFANRNSNLYFEVHNNILDQKMLTTKALEHSKLIANHIGQREGGHIKDKLNKTKERIEKLSEVVIKTEEQQNKNAQQLIESLAKQGVTLNAIEKNIRGQTEHTKRINDDLRTLDIKIEHQNEHITSISNNIQILDTKAEEAKIVQEEILFYAALNHKLQTEMVEKAAMQAKQEEIKSHFNAATNVGNLLIQLGQVTESKDLQKFGALTVASTQAFYAACQITGSLGVAAVSGIAMITPVTAMIAGAVAVVSILSSKGKDNKAMAAMFDQLFSALNTIHKEMHEQFDLVHKELFEVFNIVHESIKRNEYNFIKVFDKLDAITKFQEFSHKEIIDAVHANLISEISKATYMIKNDKMPEKLDDKLKYLENLDYAANHLAFDNVLNNPDKNPGLLFIDKSIEQQLENRPLEQNVGFLINYAKTILGVKDLPEGKEIPNPALFFSITSILPRFLLDIVNQDAEKVGLLLKTLEPTIAANNNVISTIKAMKQQNVVGEMLKVYHAELNDFNSYIVNENKVYSKALGLFKTLNLDLPSSVAAHTIIAMRDGTCVSDGTYYLAEKLGLGVIKWVHLAFVVKEIYTDKHTGKEIPVTCSPDPGITNALPAKLQSIRIDFINKLTSEPKFKEHINELKIYEKMVSFYSALTGGEVININYINTFENHLNSAKASHANEAILITPIDYFNNQAIWFVDNSKIDVAQNKWHASNSIYLEFADKIKQSLNYTGVLLNQVKAYNEMPKIDCASNQAAKESSKALQHLKNYFETINDAKDELVNTFPKGKLKEFGKFNKYFDTAKGQVDALETAPTANQLEDLYCNIFCTDKVLKFNVKTYRDAASSDETLLDIKHELREFTEKAIICDC
ncbi:hypothetical protein NF27_AV00020 [Candidatus Jidaibacter acanthamoeba]|uniref:Uncharacterized protein n=1 Tax=Candidatus Jidaibacter acanthamoebae TaxID=86105 RepID=A0A0C1QL61_9RICK|nr:hypothetical protein [Candidatus Jidaibacter acanthamoeba]KIE06239.1 hypothetical protein NF27_AV00020 [Candidatus Jidaibacter acanthamoeba]